MGINWSPDIAQEIMEILFCDLEPMEVYIDDVGVFSHSWDLYYLDIVLQWHKDNGFTVVAVV